jgi:trans-aconitate 2-methyltransferase
MSVPWDANSYERVAEAQFRWAKEVVAWRAWAGDEHVLDAGCGPGRVSEELLRMLPKARVTAADRDPDMLAKARRRLDPFGPRARVVEADLEHLPALGPVDVVLSTAVLHWVSDHPAAFAGFHRNLRQGGEVLLQFGGQGNIARLVGVARRVTAQPRFRDRFADWTPPWRFDTPATTRLHLKAAGFADVRTWLEARPTPFAGRAEFLAFCAAAPLRPHLGRLAAVDHGSFLEAVGDEWAAAGLPLELDYVRLNARARRP